MSGRDPEEEFRVSTPLELLFDLCFAGAVGQAAAHISALTAAATVTVPVAVYMVVIWALQLRRDRTLPRYVTWLTPAGAALVLAATFARDAAVPLAGLILALLVAVKIAVVPGWGVAAA